MIGFKKRVSENISRIPQEQLDHLFSEMVLENESFFAIFDSLSTGLLILDNEAMILSYNKAIERFLRFTINPEDVKSNKNSSYQIWDIVSDPEISNFLKNTIIQKKTNVHKEFSVISNSSRVRFLKIEIIPFVKNKEISGSIIKVEDITDQKKSEILAHRMENLASLTNLAASMAHEIKNPLGAISIHIQLLQKIIKKCRESDGKLPEEKFMEKKIDVINEEIERLNNTVVDFLFAVRPLNADLELVNVNSLIEEICSFIKTEFSENNIELKWDFENSTKDCLILIDKKLFRQVLMNLAQNSIAAINEKHENLEKDAEGKNETEENIISNNDFFEVKTFLSQNNEKFTIEVSDSGCGMSEETVSKIFEPYFTTKANGTGLGMTTVYKIIKEFGGEISLTSKINSGTKFLIELPVPQTDKKLLPGV